MSDDRDTDAPTIGRFDAFQRRHRLLGLPLAVIYKYFDDQGPYLAAIIAYYAFFAIFPILLIGTSVLGFFLQGDPELRDRLLDTALSQFPIVGDQLGRPEGLSGSTTAIVIGVVTALYGAINLGQAVQNAANVVWAVPRNSRANPFLQRFRSLIFLAIGGLGILTIAIASSVLANLDSINTSWSDDLNRVFGWVGFALTVVVFMMIFHLISGSRATWRRVLPGAVVTALLWQLLQVLGQAYVSGVINRASQMNGTFALVLGLMGFIFLAALMVVIGLEAMVVVARRLYPRALLTPFTDNVVLTDADQRAYISYAKMQRHKGFQTIEARFEDTGEQAAVVEPAVETGPAPDAAPETDPVPPVPRPDVPAVDPAPAPTTRLPR
ncbi:MAG: YihY/virulence factor BrkB family protein [Aeromicrobium sp.]|uniref:YihY/virulence factor BrkB family protein n=1 Tax=Aeromicrobium sp. TaxID=1871063 RepID=UPI0025BBD7E8|nr:YihY/virulence factor BrkB family protein [Aeromicrobium sp.]MCK5892157.1 YihY/virulence factor BrkB family protein [Aeromicrobium sp.]MDF1704183.1 YihY/virulence factor BrkB family protein [Aeromicrobium sp.]